MTKLLRADFFRLFKSISFWVSVFAGFGWGAVKIYNSFQNSKSIYIDSQFDAYPGIPLIIAVLVALFIGTDFSGRTIRNKIAIGHSRASVYLSYIIVCIAGGFAVNIAYIAGVYAAGLILGGKMRFHPDFAELLIIEFMAYAAMCSFLVVLCLLIGRRTAGIIAALLIAFFTPMIAESIHIFVAEPEFLVNRQYNKEHTSYIETTEPNPRYDAGVKRVIFTAADNFLPMGQLEQLHCGHVVGQFQMIGYPLYSLGFIAVTTAAGIAAFRKKNIQ